MKTKKKTSIKLMQSPTITKQKQNEKKKEASNYRTTSTNVNS